jgi:hypothetical protein
MPHQRLAFRLPGIRQSAHCVAALQIAQLVSASRHQGERFNTLSCEFPPNSFVATMTVLDWWWNRRNIA